jgi:hypothetical protein
MERGMRGFKGTLARALAAMALFGFAPSAFAYLDPSTGSMILSAIVGVFATLVLAIKTYWYKLKSFFTGRTAQTDADAEPLAESSAEENDRA